MNNSKSTACETITKLNQECQNQRLRLFAKVDISTKIKILALQKQLFHQLKNTHIDADNTVLTLSSLILAIDAIEKEFDDVNLKAIKLRAKNSKTKVKRQKVLGYWAIVRTLKLEQNMSFRDIATYFAKYHRLEISYSTIHALWIELENNIQTKEK
jgi:hypothetical protein